MSRRPRSTANGEADFKSYRESAPSHINDNQIRKLMKEQSNNKEKISATISGWWDTEVIAEPVEEWATISKEKKTVNKFEGQHRNGPGGGRGGARDFIAGGRGAGRGGAGRGDRPDRRSTSPRADGDADANASGGDTAAATTTAPSTTNNREKGNNTREKGIKKDAKVDSRLKKEKKEEKPVERILPVPNMPDSVWNNLENCAQRIKRIEEEKNKPPPAPVVEEKPAAAEKPAKKKREKKPKAEKKVEKAVVEEPVSEPVAPVVEEEAVVEVPAPEPTSSLLDDLTLNDTPDDAPDAPSSPVQSKSTDADVEGSPKIGLKMGKWENKAEKFEAPSLSFGSFGNASSSLVAEESSASWGSAVQPSSDVPATGVWSSGDQPNQASNGEVAPPGLVSGKNSRSAPGQSRNKQDNQQNPQMQGGYQQPPGFGGMPNRGAPVSTMQMQMPYVQPGFDQQGYAQQGYAQQFGMAVPNANANAPTTAAPVPAVGSNVNGGSLPGANPPVAAQPYAQPPSMAPPYPYAQNPYFAHAYGMQQYYGYPNPSQVQPGYNYHQQGRNYNNNRGQGGYDQYSQQGGGGGTAAAGGDNSGQFGNKHGNKAESTDASAGQAAAPVAPTMPYNNYGMNYGAPGGGGQWGGYGGQQYGMQQYPAGGQGQGGNNRNYNNNNRNYNSNNNSDNTNSQTGYWNK